MENLTTRHIPYNVSEENAHFYDACAHFAVDWNWHFPNQWARSVQEGQRWHPEEGLDKDSYNALLKEFGLEKNAAEFPMDKIVSMSPANLTTAQWQKVSEEKTS